MRVLLLNAGSSSLKCTLLESDGNEIVGRGLASARTYPVPESWTRDIGIRRYGFHGLSHANARARPDCDVARRGSRARILVIAAREDLSMLAEVKRLIRGGTR